MEMRKTKEEAVLKGGERLPVLLGEDNEKYVMREDDFVKITELPKGEWLYNVTPEDEKGEKQEVSSGDEKNSKSTGKNSKDSASKKEESDSKKGKKSGTREKEVRSDKMALINKVNKVISKGKQEAPDGEQIAIQADDIDEMLITEQYKGAAPLVFYIKVFNKEKRKEELKKELSWEGITECARRQGNIEVMEVHYEKVDERGKKIAKARVKDLSKNLVMVGTAERARAGGSFYYTVLASKAIRNALKKIISPAIKQQVIKEADAAKSGIVIKPIG